MFQNECFCNKLCVLLQRVVILSYLVDLLLHVLAIVIIECLHLQVRESSA